MVSQHVGEDIIFTHGDALCPSEIVFGDDSIGHLIVIADEVGGHIADD